MNLQRMTLADLNKLHDKVAALLPAKRKEAIDAARNQMMATAKKMGFKPNELTIAWRKGRRK